VNPKSDPDGQPMPLIRLENLEKHFPIKKGVFGRTVGYVHAVDGVTLSIRKGETLGLVGESGCGKTTLGRAVLRLVEPSSGRIVFQGKDLTQIRSAQLRDMRRRLQIVFQDPYSSLDPRLTVEKIVGEGFAIHGPPPSVAKNVKFAERERIHQLVEQVGLSHDHLSRLPHEFSGGQKQRIALARALALEPDFVVLDEPTSALDVSVQAQALNLLRRLQGKFGLTYLFISHDLSVVAHMSDRIAVMYLGKVIELALVMEFLGNAKHPYTQALIASIPIPDPKMRKERKGIEGEVPSPVNPPMGCRFHPRCSFVMRTCGWEGRDLAFYLTEKERIHDSKHPMSDKIRNLRPEGFTLIVELGSRSDEQHVLHWLSGKVAELRKTLPMFDAITAIDLLSARKDIALKCSTAKIRPETIAKRFLGALDDCVDYKVPGDAMHGVILKTKLDGARVSLSVGKDKGREALDFVKDFVLRLRKTTHPEFRALSFAVDTDRDLVVVESHMGKLPRSLAAVQLAERIHGALGSSLLSAHRDKVVMVRARRSSVVLKALGPEKEWGNLVTALERYIKDSKEAGDLLTGAVTSVSIKNAKGPAVAIGVKFEHVSEPELVDIGNGHLVACRLCKGSGCDIPGNTEGLEDTGATTSS